MAVLGCAVNGIGEASHADFGITGAKNEGLIFAHGKPLRKVPQAQLVDALFEEIDKSLDRGAVEVDEPQGRRGRRVAGRRSRRRTPASSRPSGSPRWSTKRPRRASPTSVLPRRGGLADPARRRKRSSRPALDEDASPVTGRRFTRT